ncbi:MAG: N-acetylglutaminylglutamine synthetase [Alphaproteobacteria bacterium]|nr:N-acetylglutaminylglutamine synthetase [Alphaproteobacteria bacterium]
MSNDPAKPDADKVEELASLKNWGAPVDWFKTHGCSNTAIDCGWGRLIFGQTFDGPEKLAALLQEEERGRRDIALYVREPHIVLAAAPLEVFLDPSHTFRRRFDSPLPEIGAQGLTIRQAQPEDQNRINAIFSSRGMILWEPDFVQNAKQRSELVLLVAEEPSSGEVVGIVEGVDHVAAIKDPDNGSSLWGLAVDPKATRPGIGQKLSLALAHHFKALGRAFMDLSVMHDNDDAIGLYEKLGFERVPVYCVKKKNTVNERLFVGPDSDSQLNIYAQIIVDEARRRGIRVEVEDEEAGLFRLILGARSVACRESLCDLTSAVAMSRCDDKSLTHRLLKAAGLMVPAQTRVANEREAIAFLEQHNRVVLKPVKGEQGQGVFVDLQSSKGVKIALQEARKISSEIVVEQFVTGDDVRIIVIDGAVVAAAIRKPASIVGDGKHSVHDLIEKQSRRREAATKGESRIPIDEETERCLRHAGYSMDSVLEDGQFLAVRKTANLHTGGTIHDVTPKLNESIAKAAVMAAEVLNMPVVGLDFVVPAIDQPAYWIIEANERPGLANHEPAPTVERFIDFLFPTSSPPLSQGVRASRSPNG